MNTAARLKKNSAPTSMEGSSHPARTMQRFNSEHDVAVRSGAVGDSRARDGIDVVGIAAPALA